ncbi:hypothetical protein NUACC21_43040 [Scytonema sp. NUACC21]
MARYLLRSCYSWFGKGNRSLFKAATGTLAFSEVDTISLDPRVPTRAKATLTGSFQVFPVQTVPEPKTTTTFIGMGVIWGAFLLYQYRRRPRFKDLT